LTLPVPAESTVEIVTRTEEDGLEILRHDAAHVLAEAVKELFPETQITIGPAITNGFYYDFYRETPFTPDDFGKIEKRMAEIVDRDEAITREVWDRPKAIQFYKDQEKPLRQNSLKAFGDEPLSFYRQRFYRLVPGSSSSLHRQAGQSF
jgi:threonyl-tRNA synthetase